MIMFLPLENPKSITTLALLTLMMVASIGENVALSAYFMRNMPKHIRGTLIGITTALGTLGLFVFSIVGGYVYDTVDHKTPFLIVGVLDLCFVIVLCILNCLGKLEEKGRFNNKEEEEVDGVDESRGLLGSKACQYGATT
jgi:MFS family permease